MGRRLKLSVIAFLISGTFQINILFFLWRFMHSFHEFSWLSSQFFHYNAPFKKYYFPEKLRFLRKLKERSWLNNNPLLWRSFEIDTVATYYIEKNENAQVTIIGDSTVIICNFLSSSWLFVRLDSFPIRSYCRG